MKSEVIVYIFLLIFFLIFGGCNFNINKNVIVADGTSSSGYSTVNGHIKVGAQCEISGSCKTVNGNITINQKSRVSDLQTVNGYVSIKNDVLVKGDVETINGYIECSEGVSIGGGLSTVNGNIKCLKTEVANDLKTYNGNINISRNSIIKGNIVIEETDFSSAKSLLYIKLSDRSVIKGNIEVRDKNRKVKVYIQDGSKIEGKIINAELVEK